QAAGGLRSTKNSAILIIFGSVPSSGRPAFEMTDVTSGNWRRIDRIRAQSREASLTERLGGSIILTHSVPSFSSGRNSLPKRGTRERLPARSTSGAARTAFGCLNALNRAGREGGLQSPTKRVACS